jgi:hypothetical protein
MQHPGQHSQKNPYNIPSAEHEMKLSMGWKTLRTLPLKKIFLWWKIPIGVPGVVLKRRSSYVSNAYIIYFEDETIISILCIDQVRKSDMTRSDQLYSMSRSNNISIIAATGCRCVVIVLTAW